MKVFVVEGQAASEANLAEVMKAIGTVKVLKYGTKTAIQKETEAAAAAEFSLNAINGTYYVTTDELNVRNGCSTDEAVIGTLFYGDEVTVNGSVQRGGADYGWYQIQFNGGVAYVSSSFLSQTKPAEKKPAASTNASSGSGSASNGSASAGSSFSVYREDGSYVGEMVPNSDGHYYVNEIPFDISGDGTFWGGAGAGMAVYTYSAWEKLFGTPASGGTDNSSTAATQHGLESQGSNRPVTITFTGGAWFDEAGVEYYDQNNGTFLDVNGDYFDVVW